MLFVESVIEIRGNHSGQVLLYLFYMRVDGYKKDRLPYDPDTTLTSNDFPPEKMKGIDIGDSFDELTHPQYSLDHCYNKVG